MKIAKEGNIIIRNSAIIFALIVGALFYFQFLLAAYIVSGFLLLKLLFIIRFFRLPNREQKVDSGAIFAPADGVIVAVERVNEGEYFKDERLQVSIFMSVWNVHANWYPVAGEVKYFRHHHGKFMVANHPKSSTANERTTTVVASRGGEVLFRQVAGYIARRIVSYVKVGTMAEQNTRFGFIKFGSRIDIFLPVDCDIQVKLKDKVVGSQTVIAKFKE